MRLLTLDMQLLTLVPNHLSTHLSLPLDHKTTQNSVEKVAMWRRGEGWLEVWRW